MVRIFFLIVFAGLITASPARAEKDDTLLNYLFPSVFGTPDRGPKAQDTLIAPFAQDAKGSKILDDTERAAMVSPENSIALDQPHRSNKYISDWATEAVAGVFSFSPDKIKETAKKNNIDLGRVPVAGMNAHLTGMHLATLKVGFTETGAKNVTDYLATTNILAAMQRGQQTQGFTKNVSQIMNEGNFGGTYRWLIDIPVTVSILPPGMTGYTRQNLGVMPATQNITVRVQVARMSSKKGYKDGMAIETFTILGASS